ncbi:hypothetical protein [Agromyces mangrovi Wang et al. 2018]|uniref:hypothetical protein n=1 Tax=Agromyces mangrovi TaxID=1858653 RepID=UPI002573ED7D|nr:hypothetical protein [Agromyces mangrovi]BDZ65610.1 hypothetical protein GCM10025877_25480 [Agromyces mangrovi]
MTMIGAPAHEAQPGGADAAPPAPPRRRAGAVAGWIVAAIAVVALAGWAAWAALGASALGGVRVVYDAEPLRCDGSAVHLTSDPWNEEFLQPMAELTPGMSCELRVQVVNGGWVDVTVREVWLEGMGSGNLLGLRVDHVNPNGPEPLSQADETFDAGFEILGGLVVPAGMSQAYTAAIRYDGGAEMVECGSQGWNPVAVRVEALGASRLVQPADEFAIWFFEGDLAECEELGAAGAALSDD